MRDDNEISGFGSFSETYDAATGAVIDFTRAHKLQRSGSTCEVYETVLHRRRVFVKRLRPEFRDNPQYRSAFDKEFDLGVSLTHNSLPRYVAIHDDYIVMDFVEGETLAELIARNDNRLHNRDRIRNILLQLVDVIDYLHSRNVVHCDVKADNVIVSPYADRPITLVDLDKAYSAWLDSTPGNPQNYDCVDCANGEIDYRGIGKIAEKLGDKRFARLCMKNNITADNLCIMLKRKRLFNNALIFSTICLFLVICILLTAYYSANKNSDTLTQQIETPATGSADSIPQGIMPEVTTANELTADVVPPTNVSQQHESISEREADKSLDEIVKSHYGPLYKRHEFLRELMADTTAAAERIRLAYTSYADAQMKAQNAIIKDVREKYALTDGFDAINIIHTSKQWSKFMTADAEITRLVSKEIKSRQSNR